MRLRTKLLMINEGNNFFKEKFSAGKKMKTVNRKKLEKLMITALKTLEQSGKLILLFLTFFQKQ